MEMFYDVLENNWPASMVAHFRKKRKRSKHKYVLMSGWRPKLVKLENKKRPKKSPRPTTKGTNRQSPKIQSSLLHSVDDMLDNNLDNNSFLHLIEEQVGNQGIDVMEKLDIELPIQVTDEDTDIKVATFAGQTYTT